MSSASLANTSHRLGNEYYLDAAGLHTLESIADYIAEDNPVASYDVTEAVRQAVGPLADFPEMGRRGRIAGIRELPVAGFPYIVIYRNRGNTVEILEVFHTSRRFPPDL